MRDNNENMIELIDVSNEKDVYSSVIRCEISGEKLNLRFGIDHSDYDRLKSILQYRPFENTSISSYRYFFPLSYRKDLDNEDLAFINVRVEQLDKHKQYEFSVSRRYISNVLWFNTLTSKKEIEQMIVR